jgi:hypothetical protein
VLGLLNNFRLKYKNKIQKITHENDSVYSEIDAIKLIIENELFDNSLYSFKNHPNKIKIDRQMLFDKLKNFFKKRIPMKALTDERINALVDVLLD